VALRVPVPGLSLLADITPSWFFPTGVFWFSLGIVAGFHQDGLRQLLARSKRWILPALGVLLIMGIAEWELMLRLSGAEWISPRATVLDDLFSLAFLMGFLAMERPRLPLQDKLNLLGSRSYGVYLVHSLVLLVLAKSIYHFVPALLGMQWAMQPLLVAAGLGLPLLLMTLVRISPARVVYELQFG
jgi:peptidoglycan/LPS O-acetylase OafA/YrhL